MAYYSPYLNLGNGQDGPTSWAGKGQAGNAGSIPPSTAPLMNQQTSGIKPVGNPYPGTTNYKMTSGKGMTMDQGIGLGASAVTGIADAMSQKSTDPMDYSIDPWAGFVGSGKGMASGGWIGAVIGGSVAQLGTFNKVHSALRNTSDNVQATSTDALGRPVYNGQSIQNAAATNKALRQGVKAINSSIDPATHLISYVRGTERQLKRKIRRMRSSTQDAQQDFTNQANSYNANQLGMANYQNAANKTNRMRSLYSAGNSQLY